MRRKKVLVPLACLAVFVVFPMFMFALGRWHLPAPTFADEDFGILALPDEGDQDKDGIPDQEDIVLSARAYVGTRPRYGSAYYQGGWPDDGRGVCTDVVACALLGAGWNLRELVNQDVTDHPEAYDIPQPDIDIDYRRVPNLLVWFQRNAITLTCDAMNIDEWRGGDVVVWDGHIGIVSDRRNADGIPLVIHHWGVLQLWYEEDVLTSWGPIVGHFRLG